MDDDELGWALDALERTDAALRLIGPGRRPIEVERAAAFARTQLEGLRGILAVARQEADVKRRTLLMALPVLAVSPAAVERMAAAHRTDGALLGACEEVLLDGSATPIVAQWVRSRLAHELAGDATFRALDDVTPGEEPAGLHVEGGYWASGNRLVDVEAVGLARTGRADDAERLMRAEVAATPDSVPRRHVGIGMVLAHVHVEQGEPEEAAVVRPSTSPRRRRAASTSAASTASTTA